MRRIATAIVTTLVLAAPSAALAHHGHQGGSWKETPTPTPQPAGAVESFEGEALTIKLTNGSLVTGDVTEGTHLICVTPPQTSEPAPTPSPGSWAHSSNRGHHRHHRSWGHESWWHHGYGRWHRGHGHHGFPGGPYGGGPGHGGAPGFQACETSALTQGATVLGADLHIGSEGATWQDVVVESQSQS